jgi:TolB-like protein
MPDCRGTTFALRPRDVAAEPVMAEESPAEIGRVTPDSTDDESGPSSNADKRKKKVRSAWISFVSRILAQLIGAAATVVLGVIVLQRYQPFGLPGANSTPAPVSAAAPRLSSERAPGLPYLAVLPFENYSEDPRHDPFANALTERVVSGLSRLQNLRVVSRTSSMHYRGAKKPLSEIGRELGVDLLVEGSFVRHGARLHVVVQLIDARRDEHVWTETYRRSVHDVLALHDELTSAIVKDVEKTLRGGGQWQAALPESRRDAPATGMNSQR